MWRLCLLFTICTTLSCGYKLVGWSSDRYTSLAIRPVQVAATTRTMKVRMRDALIERCLAGSALKPVDTDGDLILDTHLLDYRESVIATGPDGRTERIQFSLRAHFKLKDRAGKVLWQLENYQYSDQIGITISNDVYREEAVHVQDKAMRTMADLVVTNMTLALNEREAEGE